MIRKLNRVIQDYLRPIRLNLGRKLWDRKDKKYPELIKNNRVDMSRVKSILFLRYDGKIGDMVINTLMFREIQKRYPDIKIGVVSRGAATDIIKFNPHVNIIYNYKKGKESEVASEIAKENYDIVVDFSEMLRVNQMKFINLCKAKINIGLDKDGWNLFDLNYKKDNRKHITDMYKNVLSILGVENPDLSYDIYTGLVVKDEIKRRLRELGNPESFTIINPYAASKHRSFNIDKILEISSKVLKDTKDMLIFIGETSKKHEIEEIIEVLGDRERIKYPTLSGILEVAELIKHSTYVITPDTSIVHIAAAFKKPMTAVYRADDKEDTNSQLWAPNYKEAKQIFSIDLNKKLGEETDINLFNIDEI
ncbi:glycosyltransferase family 9 protein [Cetobacterium somerae]|uniref:glycosyltransferase family 9 protein n=1 Tax=Cetobacterium somerae TaxID=188913 RepID=UPI0022521CBA|nr:glycosyltransferase family 9 protein [Cetobacterium somerae]MCX3068179.1 glycosyltransferase family 9 protein [Cetobacterium somerae]